jgi:glutamate racemase
VKNELQRALPDLPIIDPSLAVARHARSLLSSEPLGKSGTTRFITTGSVLRLVHGVARYLGEDIGAEQVHI